MYGFHGRAAELLKLHRRLREYGAVVLQGGGGMGKTSLAREAARWWHRIGLRPGGAAFFSFESRQGADRAVLGFVQYVEGERFVQGSPEELWGRAVRYFREREVLWVWDNFESTLAQYQKGRDEGSAVFVDEERDRLRRLYGELTRKGSQGWLVVTCRPDDTGLGRIAEMPLGGLAKADALDMACEVLALKDVKIGDAGYEREAVEELLEAVERHPLSIELVMAHCKVVKPAEAAKDLRKVVGAASQVAGEDRNKSLLASLRWSTGRLSEETRGELPYLAWFEGGAFEAVLEAFCDVGPEVWGRVREELLATALVRVDDEVGFGGEAPGKPYLGFHPTLPYAAEPDGVADKVESGKRFVGVYYGLAASVDKSLDGAEPAGAMRVMLREEGNLRRAMVLAFERGDHEMGVLLAATIDRYLASAGRVRDRARLAGWVQERMAAASGPAKWQTEREHAWGLFLVGNRQAAVDLLTRQLGEIEAAGGNAWDKARCLLYHGRILYHAGQPQHALGPLAKAIEGFEAAGDRGNLSAALGDQANALMLLGKLAEALASAERGVAIDRERGDARSEAAGLGQMAAILTRHHRFGEAEQRHEEALDAARRARDEGLERTASPAPRNPGYEAGHHTLALARYKEALTRFQAADDRGGEMRTACLLGNVEMQLGHHEAARAWYAEAERLARELGDEVQLGANAGILLQEQALALPDDAKDEPADAFRGGRSLGGHFSRGLSQKRGNEMGAADSLLSARSSPPSPRKSQMRPSATHSKPSPSGSASNCPTFTRTTGTLKTSLPSPAIAPRKPPPGAPRGKRSRPSSAASPKATVHPASRPNSATPSSPPLPAPPRRPLRRRQPIPLPTLANAITHLLTHPDPPLGAAGRPSGASLPASTPTRPPASRRSSRRSSPPSSRRARAPAPIRAAARADPALPHRPRRLPPAHATCPCGSGKLLRRLPRRGAADAGPALEPHRSCASLRP